MSSISIYKIHFGELGKNTPVRHLTEILITLWLSEIEYITYADMLNVSTRGSQFNTYIVEYLGFSKQSRTRLSGFGWKKKCIESYGSLLAYNRSGAV